MVCAKLDIWVFCFFSSTPCLLSQPSCCPPLGLCALLRLFGLESLKAKRILGTRDLVLVSCTKLEWLLG